jgi:mRNA-degrading endonuclease toxin of MazEF toxin-antitoxin module
LCTSLLCSQASSNGLTKESTADCVQMKSLDHQRFLRKLGELSMTEFQAVMDGVALCLGLWGGKRGSDRSGVRSPIVVQKLAKSVPIIRVFSTAKA